MRVPILVFAVLLPGVLTAQTRNISGRVRSQADTTSIPAAVITVPGTSVSAVTSGRGEFVLRGVRGDSVDLRIERAGIRTTMARVATGGAPVEIFVEEDAVEVAALSVTGTRDAQRATSTQPALSVEADELESFNELTLGDVLRRTPGLTVSGPPGEVTEIRMRGLGPEYTQVLIDGRRLPGGRERRDFQIDQLPSWLAERIVVLRNTSAMMPSQAVAGTVNIVLRRIPTTSRLDWGVGTGAADLDTDAATTNAALHYGASSKRFGYLLSGAVQRRRNQHEGERTTINLGTSAEQTALDRNENIAEDLGAAPHFAWLMKSSALTFSPLYLHSIRERGTSRIITLGAATFDEAVLDRSRRDTWRTQLAWTYAPGRTSIGLVAGVQGSNDEQDRTRTRFLEGAATQTEVEHDTRNDREWFGGARLQLPVRTAHDLVMGADVTVRDRGKRLTRILTVRADQRDRSTAADHYDVSEADVGGFIEDRFNAGRRTTLTGGLRFEGVRNVARSKDDVEATQDGMLVIPSLHVLHRLGSTNLRASATRATRRPQFDHLVPFVQRSEGTMTRPDLLGNPELDVEASSGIELSVEHFFSQRSTLGINALAKRVSDRIEMSMSVDAGGRYAAQPINAGDGYLLGIEMDGRTVLRGRAAAFEVWGNVSFYHSRLTDAFTGEIRMFSRQPEYVLNAGIQQNFRRLGLTAGASFNRVPAALRIETSSGVRQNDLEDEGDHVSAFVAKRLSRNVVLRLSGHNLLQADRVRSRTSAAVDGQALSTVQSWTATRRSFYLSLRSSGRRG